MRIHWELRIRFRAFGITFGKLEKSGDVPVPVPPLPVPIDKVLVDERGVWLRVSVV